MVNKIFLRACRVVSSVVSSGVREESDFEFEQLFVFVAVEGGGMVQR